MMAIQSNSTCMHLIQMCDEYVLSSLKTAGLIVRFPGSITYSSNIVRSFGLCLGGSTYLIRAQSH
jgi:hypothetical protein